MWESFGVGYQSVAEPESVVSDPVTAPLRLQFDGWTWPHPDRVADIEWQLRYGRPTRQQLLEAAGMLSALLQLTSPHITNAEQVKRKLAAVHRALRVAP